MNLGQAKKLLDNPNFVKWFGKSTVKDETGAPLRVYHGTGENFDVFDAGKTNLSPRGNSGSLGFYFTGSPQEASHYASGYPDSGAVVPAYLSIRNPKIIERESSLWDKILNSRADAKSAKESLMIKGYDGAITPLGEYVAFNPNQIKSAIGNSGTFDHTNPNILKGATAIAAGSTLLPKDALAKKHKQMESDQALQDAYSPVDMIIAGATGGATMGLRAISALADPVINYAIDRMLGD